MSKMGRPTKLNDDIQRKIVTAIKAGNYIETASAFAGINKSTLYDWMKRGGRERQRLAEDGRRRPEKNELKYLNFTDAVEEALAESEIRDVMKISAASEDDWKAAAWRLERKFPDRWGRKTQFKEDTEEKELRIAKMRAELEITQFELDQVKGLNIDDAHDLGKSYEEALSANIDAVFDDELSDSDDSE